MRQHRKPQPRNGSFYGMPITNHNEGETWIEGEEFCYTSYDGTAMIRRAYARFADGKLRVVRCCIPDTYFTIPAVAKVAGKRIKGFLSSDTDKGELKFTAYTNQLGRDAKGMLIKTPIPENAVSVCVEDFCGYSNPGHSATSFWADYYPNLGFTRFGGDHWNVPDMPSNTKPTENEVDAWTVKHNFGLKREK